MREPDVWMEEPDAEDRVMRASVNILLVVYLRGN